MTDNGGLQNTDTATISIANVAPTVTLGDDVTIYKGQTFTDSGSFSDPCSTDTWTGTVDYGDGSGSQSLTLNGDKTFSLSHTYANDGNYTVTVTVTDDDGGSDNDTLEVTVLPAAVVTVTSGDRYATEPNKRYQTASDTAQFVISRTGGDPNATLRVNFSLAGNAVYGTNDDYTLTESGLPVDIGAGGTGYVEIFPGYSSATIIVKPEYDDLDEGVEFAVLTIEEDTGYTIGSPGAEVAAIMDPNVEHTPASEDLIVACDTCGSDGNGNHTVPQCIPGLGCFRYMSDANPHPTVAVDALILHEYGGATLSTVEAELNLGGITETVYYDGSGITATDLYRLAVQVDASTLGTRRYDWTMTVTQTYSDSTVRVGAYTGSKNLVDLSDSPFGRRWGAGEYQKLISDDEGVLWLYMGNLRLFANDGSGGYEAITDPLGHWTLSGSWAAGFTVTHVDGTEESFDTAGMRTTSTDRNGNETSYSYTSGRLTGIIFPGGRQTTLAYDGNGKLDYVEDYAGRRTDFTIDANGQIQSIAMPDPDTSDAVAAPTYEFHYVSATGMMDWMEDPADVRTAYVHDSAGLLSKIERADGTADEWYDEMSSVFAGGLKYVGDGTGTPANKATLTDYLASGLAATRSHSANPSSESEITVDRFGQANSIVDADGNETTIVRDEDGRIVRLVEPDPDGAGTEYESAVTEFHYDSRGNVLWTRHPDGSYENWTYHGTFNVATSYTFTPPSGSGESTLRSVYTIDGLGNVTRERQISNLDDSVYTSDATANPDIVIDYTYTDGTETGTPPKGLLETVTFTSHPDAPVTSYEYNAHGELVKVRSPDPDGAGSLTSPVTDYVWNSDGTLASVTETDVGATFSNTTDYDYDEAGRLIEVRSPDPDGSGGLPRPVVKYTYNADGTVDTITETTEATGAAELVTTHTYTNGQLTMVTYPDPDGSGPEYSPVTEYVYADGLLTDVYAKSADPSGAVQRTQYVYDAMNRLVETIYPDPDGAGPLPSPVETVYYDGAGRVLQTGEKTTDAGDAELLTDYTYDVLGRLVSMELPDADTLGGTNRSTTSYTYYASGQVKTMTDPLGAVTSYEYNDLGQLVKVTLPDPDGAGDLHSPTTEYEYDGAGRLTRRIESYDGTSAQEVVTEYTYDTLDRILTETLPDPDDYTSSGGSNGALTSPVYSYGYDAVGNLATVTDPLSGVTRYQYDALGRQTQITDALAQAAGESLHTVTTRYDDQGNVIASTDQLGRTTTYEYDDLGRVISETLPDSMYTEAGELNSGLAAYDARTGTGYVMYSEESVHTRFSSGPPYFGMSDHFITVVYEGGVWRYDGSYMTAVQFTPVSTDVLVADVDYSADTIESAEGKSGVVNGIEYGYRSGDLVFYADQFAGSYNDGEFDITGSLFVRNGPGTEAGELNSGLAAYDARTGTGYVMYSEESVHTRFSSGPPYFGMSDHFITVVYEGGVWRYDGSYMTAVQFTPVSTDVLVADVDYSADTIESAEGKSGVVNGIEYGYRSGDLVFYADQFAGSYNDGEFDITGSLFVRNGPGTEAGELNSGLAAYDARTGTGYVMYSEESVHTRFSSGPPYFGMSDHFITVVYEGGVWRYDGSYMTAVQFTPVSTDVLVADVDYSADTIESAEGKSGVVNGIEYGYRSGDLVFYADQFAGSYNDISA